MAYSKFRDLSMEFSVKVIKMCEDMFFQPIHFTISKKLGKIISENSEE